MTTPSKKKSCLAQPIPGYGVISEKKKTRLCVKLAQNCLRLVGRE